MNSKLHIDLETKSRTDLLTEGGYNYATDPSTEIICMCYAFDDEPVRLWVPTFSFPESVAIHIIEGGALYAHHAAFERLVFEYIICPDHKCPPTKLEQWHCTAFMARCNNLPAALVNTARALNVPHQKQLRGRALIKMLCIPQADGTFYSTPELLEEFYDYCKGDVESERDICGRMRYPTDEEWQDFWVNERINDRGILIDYELAVGCQAYAEEEEVELIEVIKKVTGGLVEKARGEKLKAWVVERLTEEQQQVAVRKRKGKTVYSLDKYTRGLLLLDDHLDPDVYEVLQASDFAQRSSVSKFKTMQKVCDPEDRRVRGAFIANGASASGRYSSRQLQVHNFTRKSMEDPAEVRLDIIDNIMPEDITDYYDMPIMEVLSKMLRPALIPEKGKRFMVSDWNAIEGRVAPWLANSDLGEAKLDLYREGIDTYKVAAEAIYHVSYDDINEDQRRVGKVAELACTYGGGAKAFLGMGRNYGVHMSEDEAEMVKEAWRRANPWAVQFWKDCEKASISAVRHPGIRFEAGRLSYFAVKNILCGGITLFCELPCGRLLTYPDAKVEMKKTPWGELKPSLTALRAAFTPKAGDSEWPRSSIWSGLAVENGTQGTAASLLRDKLRCADILGLPVVMHAHDEIVLESGEAADGLALHTLMNATPAWAEGLPLKADVVEMERFGK